MSYAMHLFYLLTWYIVCVVLLYPLYLASSLPVYSMFTHLDAV